MVELKVCFKILFLVTATCFMVLRMAGMHVVFELVVYACVCMLTHTCELDIINTLFTKTHACEYASARVLVMTPDPNMIVLYC